MSINQKILSLLGVWVIVTGLSFSVIYPRVIKGISDLKLTFAAQIAELNELRDHAKSLQEMQASVIKLEEEEIQPDEFFTSDTELVQEIKHIESIATVTNNRLVLNISGTADKAAAYPAKTALSQIPFTITLRGNFPDAVRFIQEFEQSYFLPPVNGLNITVGEEGVVTTTIVSAFIVQKVGAEQK